MYNRESSFALFGIIHLSKMIIASHERTFIFKLPTNEPLMNCSRTFLDTKIMLLVSPYFPRKALRISKKLALLEWRMHNHTKSGAKP